MKDIDAILEIISAISSTLTLDEILAQFVEKIALLMEADGCTIFRLQHESNSLMIVADYVSPQVMTPFGDTSHIGAVYPLTNYPAIAETVQQHRPLVVGPNVTATETPEKNLLDAFGWNSALMVSLVYRGQSVGLLNLYLVDNSAQSPFENDRVVLCEILAQQVAAVIENDQLYQEVEEGRLMAEAMQVISRALASELDYQRIVRNVADFAYRLVGVQFVYVAVPEAEGFSLVALAGHNQRGSVSDIEDALPGILNEVLLERAVQEKRPIIVTNIETETDMEPWRAQAQAQDWQSMAAVPLLSQNQVVGVLGAYARQINFFTADDVATLMSLASQAAVAIQNARLFAELEAQREKLHQVSLRLVNAQEEERRRISRELHDELGQALTALKINLDVARRLLTPEAPQKLNQSVNEASSLAMQTLEAARNLSLELHPAILDDLGLVSALRWEIDRFEQRTDQAVLFKSNLAETTLQPELEITVYRIITEALTNVVRHARADTIAVQLQVEDNQIVVIVEDNGVGFDAAGWFNSPTGRQSLGLVSMRERAELLGGRLEVISQPGHGTKIWTQLPFNQ